MSPRKKVAEKMTEKIYQKQPELLINGTHLYSARFETDRGAMEFTLLAAEAPTIVNNFIMLALDDFYDGTVFHRVIENFVIQGGDRTATGKGGPGYLLKDETTSKTHKRGSLSMANAGPNSNGSQFFITMADAPWLDRRYCLFGDLRSGEDVLDSIRAGDTLRRLIISDHDDPASINTLRRRAVKMWRQSEVRKRI